MLDTEVQMKLLGLYELSSRRTFEAIAKVGFTVGSNVFNKKLSMYAASHPKAFHHVYEWDKVGVNRFRLYELKRKGIAGGYLTMSYGFLKSKTRVPISPALRIPGKTGKYAKKRFIFENKAKVMESGLPTRSFSAKSGKALIFEGRNGQPLFVRRPRRVIIQRPGGRFTTGAFERYFIKWFSNPANIRAAIKSTAYLKNLEIGVSRALNKNKAGKREVAMVIAEISNKYSKGATRI